LLNPHRSSKRWKADELPGKWQRTSLFMRNFFIIFRLGVELLKAGVLVSVANARAASD